MVGYNLEPLAKILFPLMKCWKIWESNVEISGEKRAAPEGAWVLGGGKLSKTQILKKGKNEKKNQLDNERCDEKKLVCLDKK